MCFCIEIDRKNSHSFYTTFSTVKDYENGNSAKIREKFNVVQVELCTEMAH